MKANVGRRDMAIRLVLAGAALVAAIVTGATSVLGILLLVVAAVLAVTAVTGFCPLYRLLGVSTRRAAGPSDAL